MKFLADMGISPLTVKRLKEERYDAIHLSEQGLMRMSDREIMAKAKEESRIVLTFDIDFTDLLAASKDNLPNVIIFRLKTTLPSFVSSRLLTVLYECAENLNNGAIIIVEDYRYRIRNLPLN
jgi:predicted nuclease of predicted toxin-antitoxin system